MTTHSQRPFVCFVGNVKIINSGSIDSILADGEFYKGCKWFHFVAQPSILCRKKCERKRYFININFVVLNVI